MLLLTTETHIYYKYEIRISKSETNSNYQNPNDRNNRHIFLTSYVLNI